MNMVYKAADISKQGFHQRLDRMLGKLGLRAQLLPLLVQVREDHPEMSARSIYHLLPRERSYKSFLAFLAIAGIAAMAAAPAMS